MDPTGLQFQQQLFWTDEALLTCGISSLLIQEKQEQLLRESGQRLAFKKKKGGSLTPKPRVLLCARVHFCMLLWEASDYPDLFAGVLSAPVRTVNAIEVIIVVAEGGGVGGGDNPSGNQHPPSPLPQASPVNNPIPNSYVITKPSLPGQRLSFHTPGHRLSCRSAIPCMKEGGPSL